jgi:hypothetical protein
MYNVIQKDGLIANIDIKLRSSYKFDVIYI